MGRIARNFAFLVASGLLLVSVGYGAERKGVDPDQFAAAVERSDRIRVTALGASGLSTLYESTEREVIRQFGIAAVVVVPEEEFGCGCLGSRVVSLYAGEELVLSVEDYGESIVHCSLWRSDTRLKNTEAWLKWFDARGISEPRLEHERAERRREESRKAWARWLKATPAGLRVEWERCYENRESAWQDFDLGPFRAALEEAIPDRRDRVLSLYMWFGSGQGPWSGFPSYESVAEELLLDFSTQELVEAADPSKMNERQMEGAARLCGGWDFWVKRPDDLAMVPPALKKALWEHVKDTEDEDKLGRAAHAFRPQASSGASP